MTSPGQGRLDPPPWPVLAVVVRDDFTEAELSAPSGSQTITRRGSVDELRLDVIAAAATIAATYGRPLLVTVADPDGESTLIVTPDAEVTSQSPHTPVETTEPAVNRRRRSQRARAPKVREAKPRRPSRVTAAQVDTGRSAETAALLSTLGAGDPAPGLRPRRGRPLLGLAILATVAALGTAAVIVSARDDPNRSASTPSSGESTTPEPIIPPSEPSSSPAPSSTPTREPTPTQEPTPGPSAGPTSSPPRPPPTPTLPGYGTTWAWQRSQSGVKSVVVDGDLAIIRRAANAQLRRASDGKLLTTVTADAGDDVAAAIDSPAAAVYVVPASGPATRLRVRPDARPTRIRPPRRRADLDLVQGSLIAETVAQTWLWYRGAWVALDVRRGAFVGTLGARAVVQQPDGPATISPTDPGRSRPLRVARPARTRGRARVVAVSGTTLLLAWSARSPAAGQVLGVVEDREVLAVVRDAPTPRRATFVVDPTQTLAYVGQAALRLTGRTRAVSATAWRSVTATPGRLFAARTTAPGARGGLSWNGHRAPQALAQRGTDVAGTTNGGAIVATTTRGKTTYGLIDQ